jgi:hypothetical protein
MANFLYIPKRRPQRSFIQSKTTMARDKGAGSSESSGIEIDTMLDIIG